MTYDYYNRIFKDLPKPLAFVDMDLLDQNIQQIARQTALHQLRVASKSLRCVALLHYLQTKLDNYAGLMTYSLRETLHLLKKGFDQILIGYPVVHQASIAQIIPFLRGGRSVVFMVDAPEHLAVLEQIGHEHSLTILVCIDTDMSLRLPGLHFGVWRSQINTRKKFVAIVDAIHGSSSLQLVGIMGYEAQTAGIADTGNGLLKDRAITMLKKMSLKNEKKIRAWCDYLDKKNIKLSFVNGGGTGSIDTTALDPHVSEITVGSGFYAPALFDYYHRFRYAPAAAFALEVTRKPTKGIVTCHFGGYVASGAVGKSKTPIPYLPEGLQLVGNEATGEVQTPIICGKNKIGIGDTIFFRHAKAGELCEHFNELYLVRQGKIIDICKTYRGEGVTD